ncbi:MAG: acetolactate synthase small subunit [Proteobacteria bacterium]|nr:acetolactate synthase small subunit [Pseudomonadota bacterium]MBU1137804.1 acetolactate synthase small subunit [Pseudomonadota bacterium]
MPPIEQVKLSPAPDKPNKAVLELTVNNHPGVMSHICSLFSRRVYNMDGILCMPVKDGQMSKIWIRVNGNGQLEQIVKQLQKLEDVHAVRYHNAGHEIFIALEDSFKVI